MSDLPKVGPATESEREFTKYIGNCIADYVETRDIDRRDLIAAMFTMLYVVFDKQTHFKLEQKLAEVDDFCFYMKEKILGRLNNEMV